MTCCVERLNWLSAVQAAQGGAVGPGRHLQARDGQGRREPRAEGARGLGQGQGATRLLPDHRRRQVNVRCRHCTAVFYRSL